MFRAMKSRYDQWLKDGCDRPVHVFFPCEELGSGHAYPRLYVHFKRRITAGGGPAVAQRIHVFHRI